MICDTPKIGGETMNAKFMIEGAEETIKLLDKASSLINELRDTVIKLSFEVPNYAETAYTGEPVSEENSQ